MPRVTFVKKARKDQPNNGIIRGDSYYWWKFRWGPKIVSKTPPKPAQLTQSEFLSTLYTIQESIGALEADENLEDNLSSIIDEIRDLGGECEEKRSNMPEQLQDADTGMLLEERAEVMEAWASELESVDTEADLDAALDEIQNADPGI